MPGYTRPATVAEVLAELAASAASPSSSAATVLAGGTDLYPAWGPRVPAGARVVDISRVGALQGLREEPDGWWLGAATPWALLCRKPLPAALAALAQVAREVGGEQVQSMGTVGGNLCHASPAADGLPVWLALNAQAGIEGPQGARRLPVAQFVRGPRQVALQPGELLTHLWLPRPAAGSRSSFTKLGARRYLVISIASVAGSLAFDAQRGITHAAFAVGSCSAVAQRLPHFEQRLLGLKLEALERLKVLSADLAPLTPMDDIRATRAYRLDAVATLLQRMAPELAAGASS